MPLYPPLQIFKSTLSNIREMVNTLDVYHFDWLATYSKLSLLQAWYEWRLHVDCRNDVRRRLSVLVLCLKVAIKSIKQIRWYLLCTCRVRDLCFAQVVSMPLHVYVPLLYFSALSCATLSFSSSVTQLPHLNCRQRTSSPSRSTKTQS